MEGDVARTAVGVPNTFSGADVSAGMNIMYIYIIYMYSSIAMTVEQQISGIKIYYI